MKSKQFITGFGAGPSGQYTRRAVFFALLFPALTAFAEPRNTSTRTGEVQTRSGQDSVKNLSSPPNTITSIRAERRSANQFAGRCFSEACISENRIPEQRASARRVSARHVGSSHPVKISATGHRKQGRGARVRDAEKRSPREGVRAARSRSVRFGGGPDHSVAARKAGPGASLIALQNANNSPSRLSPPARAALGEPSTERDRPTGLSEPIEAAADRRAQLAPTASAEGRQPQVAYEPIPNRQRPGEEPRPTVFDPLQFETVPDIDSSASEFVPVPDRWRQFYVGKIYDPYNQNVLKGDLPIFGEPGDGWFVEVSLISDTLLERRKLPLPVGSASTHDAGSTDVFGDGVQTAFVENFIPSFSLIKGNTTFRPPDLELRFVPVLNFNHVKAEETGVLRANPAEDTSRDDSHIGFQELFLDYHLANLSERYDFISTRVGIQRFLSDFRGFVYASDDPGVRLFGNLDNNQFQYNLAYFSRLDKDTNSAVNTTFDSRHEQVVIANLFRQDFLTPGHTAEASVIYREDTAGDHGQHYDENGFLVRPPSIGDERPKNVYSTYLGLASDGHIDRINVTSAAYYVLGSESHNPIAERSTDIQAGMAALELSYDMNWVRFRSSLFWASGDSDPYDDKAEGFDAISDSPNFAGGDLSFFQRQGIPLIGGGGVNLFNRNSLLPDLRPGKEEGQSNFVNPGLRLYNVGVDFEILPELKLITNASYLQFDDVAVLRAVRQDGSFSRNIGVDLSAGFLYRPFLSNNVQIRAGTAGLFTDDGFENLFGDDFLWDAFTNLTLQY